MIQAIQTSKEDFEGNEMKLDPTSVRSSIDNLPTKDSKMESNSQERLASGNQNEVELSFKNLSYSIKIPNPSKNGQKLVEKSILQNLSGYCLPGELTAIMGTSGAGKTSLLNILACRINSQGKKINIKGEILANGNEYNWHDFSKFAAYVMQNDYLMETLTPREMLKFTADLRINSSQQEKTKKVEEVIDMLKLRRAADTRIGGGLIKGISGGERKRVSIGMELFTEPGILFLDEPTSGLDSFTAFLVVSLLKSIAQQGRTVVLSIHQPSSDIFWLFDRLLLLSRGKFVYQGSVSKVVDYFSSIGYQCPEYSNPADYLMEIIEKDENESFAKIYDERIADGIEDMILNFKKRDLKLTTDNPRDKLVQFFQSALVENQD